MQTVSKAYKKAMQLPVRNRAYITARIGIVSSVAQDNVIADESKNDFAYFANSKDLFKGDTVTRRYATGEQDFSKVDGSMYFAPPEDEGYPYYNNGIVTQNLLGEVYITFDGNTADIKGLTINFGEIYPTELEIESDGGSKSYTNAGALFITEDAFDAITFLRIKPKSMSNGNGRLRIEQFTCGISNTFSNKQVKGFTYKEFVSSISESLPSQDMTLTVDNQNLYYNPDNPQSAVAYMEQGQQMKVIFGYDITGNGDIEWVPEITAYLKSWSATDTEAKFTMVDIFDWKLNGTYYKGEYRESGISLYDLAIDVLEDAGMKSENYTVDTYLQNIIVYNPIPAIKHSEALQIIANAGRCVLSIDREGRVQIKSSFVPEMDATAEFDVLCPSGTTFPGEDTIPMLNIICPSEAIFPGDEVFPMMVPEGDGETAFSWAANVVDGRDKEAYAMASDNFSIVDGSLRFLPRDKDYLKNIGYVSEAVSDDDGNFEDIPVLSIRLEASYVCYALTIQFRNVAPKEFRIVTYYQGEMVEDIGVENPELTYTYSERLERFDAMDIMFEKAAPNTRIAVDNVLLGDSTDYTLSRAYNLTDAPNATRQDKIKSIAIKRNIYRENPSEVKEIFSEELLLTSAETEHTVYFSNPSYGLSVSIENAAAKAQILEKSNYFAKIKFSGASAGTTIKYTVNGYEYVVDEQYVRVLHNDTGSEISWNNPLISTTDQAKALEEWLASYYLGDVDYQITWNGDPRVDANDLFYLQLKGRDDTKIRAYQNELKFTGAWSGSLKARKVVM